MKTEFDNFGALIFDDSTMKERLPKPVYELWKETIRNNASLDNHTADAIAHAMKTWALENGCTHFCHWFQPLTGSTAEKHDSFIDKDSEGKPILSFNGKTLIKGEPDASSFPNGGLRATFEARGYTYWDFTSPAFIRDNVLCVPSIFISYNGESLDKKRPLLKSIDILNDRAVKLLHMMGYKEVGSVKPMVGLEQEYFLVDRPLYKKRLDLMLTGHTLFGCPGAKGQELNDHYAATIPTRVSEFMKDVDRELWALGIYAKTEHNEAAPAQFELAPLYADANISVDQNQIIMDILKRVAYKHNFACLLHEKPFSGINGSGKHNNYSLVTDTGMNLFDMGKTNEEQLRFLLFASCFTKAVDEYPELLRISAASRSNDFRLGASEAPPAIISIYFGSFIEEVISNFISKGEVTLESKASNSIKGLSFAPRDNSDRNRTSPIAFTGNKFEFRMLGSSFSGGQTNVFLNTIMAEEIRKVIERLEAVSKKEYAAEIEKIIKENFSEHSRVMFSGDGYSDEWVKEAARRKLPNLKSSVDAFCRFDDQKNVDLLISNGIYTEKEIAARKGIKFSRYISTVREEVKVFVRMGRSYILPAIAREISNSFVTKDENKALRAHYDKLNTLYEQIDTQLAEMDDAYNSIAKGKDEVKAAKELQKKVVPMMAEIRTAVDAYEMIADRTVYTLPMYDDMLY